jgi:16S rRNA processing protein RimM
MLDTLKIGLIVKPQGIRGELKVQPLTDDINRYKGLKEVIIDQKTYRVTETVIAGNMVFITLFGISDRNTAETFRGKFLCVKRENAIPLEQGRYYIVDIVGCEIVTDNGEKIGKVLEITSARTDIFTVKTVDDRIMRFPFLKDVVKAVDIENKKITVDGKRLLEVSCYED